MANWQSFKSAVQRGYQDTDKLLSGIQNIISWGNGQMNSYDPNMMVKMGQGLSMVDDYAHWMSPDEINDKYSSIPDDVKSGLKTTAQWVNLKGSMTNYQLKSQAEDYGLKLSDDELDLLQKRPWIQSQYLKVKKASMAWSSDQMESLMATILTDIQNWTIQHQWQLRVRLMQVLGMDNANDVDYLAEDLWSDFTANMTNGEKMQRIRTKYKELFGFNDRTTLTKVKENAVWLLNGVKKAVVNGLGWLTEAGSDTGLWLWEQTAKLYGGDKDTEWRVPSDVNLWGIDESSLSPDTKEAVDYLKAYGLWTGAYNVLKVYYDAKEESNDAKIQKLYSHFSDFGLEWGYWPTLWNEAQAVEQQEKNSWWYQTGEFVGKSIPEIYVTSKIWSALTLSKETLANLPRWAKHAVKFLNRAGTSAIEWVAFNAMEDGEVDAKSVGLFTALWTFLDPAINAFGNKVTKWWVRKRMGKDLFNSTVENVIKNVEREWGTKLTRSEWERIVADTVLEWSMNGIGGTVWVEFASNSLDKASQNLWGFIDDLQKSIITDLGKIEWKYENEYIQKMLKWLFKQSPKQVDEAYSVFRNARIWAWMSEEAVAKEWQMMKNLYENGAKEFSLLEQETIKENMRTIANTYSKTEKPLNGRLNEWWRDQQISAQNIIEDLATKNGVESLGDRYLQESVLIRAKKGFEKSATSSMSDILNRYAWRTLIGGLWGYVASQTIWEWPLSNPYVATATTMLVMAMWWSPRASLLASKIASKLSTTEAYSLINSADEWVLFKMKVWDRDEFLKWTRWVIYADTAQQIVERMEDNQVEYTQTFNTSDDEYLNDMIREKYWLY